MIKILVIIFLSNIAFGAKDCPGDMVLWRQPGNSYSDCVCPTGQSMVTDTINSSLSYSFPYSYNILHKFGRCSDNYIPVSKSWPINVDLSLIEWFDSMNPYNIGYNANDEESLKAGIYKKNFPSNSSGASQTYQLININNRFDFYTSHSKIPLTYFIVFQPYVNPSGLAILTYFNYVDSPALAYISFRINSTNLEVDYKCYPGSGFPALRTATDTSRSIVGGNQLAILKLDQQNFTGYFQLINKNYVYDTSAYKNIDLTYFDQHFSSGSSYSTADFIVSRYSTEQAVAYSGISEVLAYSNYLSDSQITQIVQKLNQKWQIY